MRVCQFRHFRMLARSLSRTGDPFLTMEVLCLLSYIGLTLYISGAADEARTRNLRDGNAMLYQLSYCRTALGGRNRARTCDPLLVRQMLSQLSYSP